MIPGYWGQAIEYQKDVTADESKVVLPATPFTAEVNREGTETLTAIRAHGVATCGEGKSARIPLETTTARLYTARVNYISV